MTKLPTTLSVLVALCVSAGLPSTCPAQVQAADRAAAEWQASWDRAEAALQRQEKEVELLVDDFLSLDASIEKRIDQIVSALAGLEDSRDSGTRVAHTKDQVIEGLEKSLQEYKQKRSKNDAQLRTPLSYRTTEKLDRSNEFLDEKIDTRVDQIMSIANSLHEHKDYKKYTTSYGTSNRNRRYGSRNYGTRRVTDEYRQNSRQSSRADFTRENVGKGAQEEITALRRENDKLRSNAKFAPSAAQADQWNEQIRRNEEDIAKLREAIGQAAVPDKTPTKSVGSSRAAHNVELTIRDMVKDLQVDQRELFKVSTDINREIDTLNRMQVRLAQIQADRPEGVPAPDRPDPQD